MTTNVIKFPQESIPFNEFLAELEDAYNEDRLTSFICIYDAKYKLGKEKKGFVGSMKHYWFGNSISAIGLCVVIQSIILKWIREQNEEVE